MDRTPLAIVAAALLLAVGFFALGIFSDSDREDQMARNAAADAFANLPAGSRRDALDGGGRGGGEARRRASGAGGPHEHGSIPGRDKRRAGSATVIGSERAGGARPGDGFDRVGRLRDIGGGADGRGDIAPSDRIPEGLRAHGAADSGGGDVVDDGSQDPRPGDASSAPEGTLFDPFNVYGGERGPDEEPYLVDQVDFLDDEHGVDMGDDSVLTFPTEGNVRGEAGTIHFEFEPDWDSTEVSGRTLLRIDEPGEWNNRVRLVKDGNYLRYMFFDNTGVELNINVPIDSWQPGEPHELTMNWDGDQRKIGLYIDGNLMGEKDYPGELILDSKTRIDLGSKGGDGYIGAGGRITNFTASDRALAPTDF